MRALVLGGTGWLGGEVVAASLARGHEVTVVSRGRIRPLPASCEAVTWDRDRPEVPDVLTRGTWDLVVDVSRDPGQVARAAGVLADRARCYAFVSSCSVYAEHDAVGADETAATVEPLADGADASDLEAYAHAKVACERAVVAAFGAERSLIVRPGLIAGPGDGSGRTTYWPWRFARADDGPVLVPDSPDQLTQVIDVRDLAAWIVEAGSIGVAGMFDAVGEVVPLGEHLEQARRASGSRTPMIPVPASWLEDQGVAPWAGERSLPLWIPDPSWRGFMARSGRRALGAGLVLRPLAQTLSDGVRWQQESGREPPASGLTAVDEGDLLARWSAAGRQP